jgi:hypothetical protein
MGTACRPLNSRYNDRLASQVYKSIPHAATASSGISISTAAIVGLLSCASSRWVRLDLEDQGGGHLEEALADGDHSPVDLVSGGLAFWDHGESS